MSSFKNFIKNPMSSEIFQIILLIFVMSIGFHLFISYLKNEMPLPNIKVLEERVRLKKKV